MNYTNNCTLCTEKIIVDGLLTSLDLNEEEFKDILKKLTRLNITNIAKFNNVYPKAVCMPCIKSLNEAYEYVLKIERAQTTLSVSIKLEPYSDDDSKFETNLQSETGYLNFCDGVKTEPQITVSLKKEKDLDTKVKKKSKKKNQFPSQLIQGMDDIQTWQDYKWMCFACNETFTNIEDFQSHSLREHGKCNMYRCIDCKHRKFSLDNFIEHIMGHRSHLRTSCPLCGCHIDSFVSHRSEHLKTDHICVGCNKNFETSKEMIEHKNAYFSTRGKAAKYFDEFICDICQKSFSKKFYIMQHMRKHLGRNKNYTCEWCGKSYYEKCHLKDHFKQHTQEKNFICKICNSAFKNQRLLKNHVATHSTEKPFSCEICSRSFRLQRQLKSHSIIHTDIFPFTCIYCNKKFRFKTILNQHIRQHTGLKPYKCDNCDKDFTNWPNYNKHMKRSHGLDMSKKKLTPVGVSYVNQETGDYTVYECTEGTEEWRQKMLLHRGRGRPKTDKTAVPSTSDGTTSISPSKTLLV